MSGSILQIYPFNTKPSAPPVGSYLFYIKTDNFLYLQDSTGIEYPFSTTTAITGLTGEGTASGPGNVPLTLDNTAVIGKVLTGFSSGPNSVVLATDTIKQAFQKLQAQVSVVSGNSITALTGDVSATGPGSVAATVNSIGGSSAANVHLAELAANAATSVNTPSTIVDRDGSGNFSAGTITATLNGNATNITAASNSTLTTLSVLSLPTTQLTGVLQAAQEPVHLGDVTNGLGSLTLNIVATSNSTLTTLSSLSLPVSQLTGILPITNGGTNSSAALSNNRIIKSSGGSIIEAAAIVGNKALASDSNGIPVASTTTDTELGYLSGVTSAIQTQINGKQATGNYITALTGQVTASGPGSVAATIATNTVTNSNLAQMAANTIKGNNTGGTANAADLTVSQVNTLLGTVTSVTATSPLSSSGGATPAISISNQSANLILAGPASGAAAAPTFRSLVKADLPLLTTATKTANYTITNSDDIIFCNTSGGAFTLTLPSPTSQSGRMFRIIDTTGNFQTNNLTLARSASEKIEGIAASKILQTAWGWYSITTNGTDWYIGG